MTTCYCRRAEDCTDTGEKETLLNAACVGLLKVGELIMQHSFWEEFREASASPDRVGQLPSIHFRTAKAGRRTKS